MLLKKPLSNRTRNQQNRKQRGRTRWIHTTVALQITTVMTMTVVSTIFKSGFSFHRNRFAVTAWTIPSKTTRATRCFRRQGQQRGLVFTLSQRRFRNRQEQSKLRQSTYLCAAVPELDDSFPDNNDDYNFYDSTHVGEFPLEEPPPDDFYAIDQSQHEPEEELVNPFSFPMPEIDQTNDGSNTVDSKPSKSPLVPGSSSIPKAPPVNLPTTEPKTSPVPEPIQNGPAMDGKSTNESSNASADISILPSEEEPKFSNEKTRNEPISQKSRVLDPMEDTSPFSSIADTTSPVQPLVAPLRLGQKQHSASSSTLQHAVPTIEANGLDDLVGTLQAQLKSVEQEVHVLVTNDNGQEEENKSINLNSPKQVSELLFGRPDMSTNKSTLEGMAGSNILAKLVLEYREIKRKLSRAQNDQKLRLQQQQQQQQQSDNSGPSIPKAMKDPVLLFDTSSFIFRAYYSSPPIHRGRDGMPIGAVMGFCSMMNKLLLTSMLRGETPRLIHCLDAPGPSFRNELYPEYKAHRPPCPLDLVPQFELINKAARAYGMIQIQAEGYEADDVIATLATVGSQTEGLDVKILSGDKDLMQLITEDDDDSPGAVYLMDPMTSKLWTHEMVREKWGVNPSQLGDVLALAGDSADNVPGVPGIGPKIAAQLLGEFETLDSLLENTHQIKQVKRREKLETHADSARISRQLVELKRNLEWSDFQAFYPPDVGDESDDGSGGSHAIAKELSGETKLSELRMQPMNPDRILAFYDEMGFFTLKQRLLDRLATMPNSAGTDPASEHRSMAPSPSSPPKESKSETPKGKKQTKTRRNTWEKKTRGIPKPEQFKDVPF